MKHFSRAMLAIGLASVASLGHTTDLLDVYRDAQNNDPVVGAAEAGYLASKEAIPQARSLLLPGLNASASTSKNERGFPGARDPFGNSISKDEFNNHNWSVTLQQPIVNLSSWFALGSAKSQVEAAEFDLESTKQQLIVRVVQAYLNVLRAQDFLDSTNSEVTAVKRQLEQVQQRFDVGLVAITDVLESQAAYDAALVRRIQADGDHGIFFETLVTLTGIAYEGLDQLTEDLPIVNPDPLDEDQWVRTALANNLGVLAAQEQLEAARRNVRSRRSDHLPTIAATATHANSVTGGANFFGTDQSETTVLGLQFNLPLYNGGAVRSRVKQASAQAEQAQELLTNQQLTVTRDTRNLFRAVATDVVRVRARQRGIASAQSALEATETGYEVGTRNIVDVLQAQQLLFASQFDYADSRYNYVTDLMLLKQAAGSLAEADLQDLNGFTDPNNQVKRLVSLQTRTGDFGTQ
jgi:outer membrane protein